MHLLLTDRLSCPRCGPGFGLILLANRMDDRRVLAGALGCSNCRDRFPIEDGVADLRPPPRTAPADAPAPPAPGPEATAQLAALLGIAEGPGYVGLIGPLSAHAPALADAVAGVEVVTVELDPPRATDREGVSRVRVGPALPFSPWTFRAIASGAGLFPVEEMLPLIGRGGRIVLERPDDAPLAALERAGVRFLLRQADWIVGLKETA